jgi:hypothetical protein
MPNWVLNKLFIHGPVADVAAFKEQARYGPLPKRGKPPRRRKAKTSEVNPKGILSFRNFVPIPPGKRDWDPYKHGMSWETRFWGTKWEAQGPHIVRESKGRVFYQFGTAWNPPVRWLEQVSEMYPRLNFSLHFWCDDSREIVRAKSGRIE